MVHYILDWNICINEMISKILSIYVLYMCPKYKDDKNVFGKLAKKKN